jgi:hypothetical protein
VAQTELFPLFSRGPGLTERESVMHGKTSFLCPIRTEPPKKGR